MSTFSEYINKKLLICNKYIQNYGNTTVNTYINHKYERIIAIGDIHGDIDLMLTTLLMSKVIIKMNTPSNNSIELNNKGNIEYYIWTGGQTAVVQVGDQVDRCRLNNIDCKKQNASYLDEASDIEILLFYTNLHEKAKIYGGAVYSLLGNHELMNSFGDIRYVSYKNLEQVQIEGDLEKGRIEIFKRGGILSKFLACTRSSILIVNDYLFVHGGVLGTFVNINENRYAIFEIINDVIKHWLIYKGNELSSILKNRYENNNLYKKIFNKDNNIDDDKIFNNRTISKFITSTDSPFYTRKLGNIEPNLNISDSSCKDVEILVKHFNLKGIIVGHTPQLNNNVGINGTCNNNLYRVDIASSKAFYFSLNRKIVSPQVLEINNNYRNKEVKVIGDFNMTGGNYDEIKILTLVKF